MKTLRSVMVLAAFSFCAAVGAQGVMLPEAGRVELDNGVVIILYEKKDVPLIGLEARIAGGAIADPDGLEGMANLVAGALEKGAGERDAAEFAEAIAAVGGELYAAAGRESIR
jgi:predicted Zn-dependent peptidase